MEDSSQQDERTDALREEVRVGPGQPLSSIQTPDQLRGADPQGSSPFPSMGSTYQNASPSPQPLLTTAANSRSILFPHHPYYSDPSRHCDSSNNTVPPTDLRAFPFRAGDGAHPKSSEQFRGASAWEGSNNISHNHFDCFRKMISNPFLSDVKIKTTKDGVVINAHKVILAAVSPTFSTMFGSENFQKQTSDVIEVPFSFESCFKTVIDFIYTGRITPTPQQASVALTQQTVINTNTYSSMTIGPPSSSGTVSSPRVTCGEAAVIANPVEVLEAAAYFQLDALKEAAVAVLCLNTTESNTFERLDLALCYGCGALKDHCLMMIRQYNTEVIHSSEWLSLPLDVALLLVQETVIEGELTILKRCYEWCLYYYAKKQEEEELLGEEVSSPEAITATISQTFLMFLEFVDFTLMTEEEIMVVEEMQCVPIGVLYSSFKRHSLGMPSVHTPRNGGIVLQWEMGRGGSSSLRPGGRTRPRMSTVGRDRFSGGLGLTRASGSNSPRGGRGAASSDRNTTVSSHFSRHFSPDLTRGGVESDGDSGFCEEDDVQVINNAVRKVSSDFIPRLVCAINRFMRGKHYWTVTVTDLRLPHDCLVGVTCKETKELYVFEPCCMSLSVPLGTEVIKEAAAGPSILIDHWCEVGILLDFGDDECVKWYNHRTKELLFTARPSKKSTVPTDVNLSHSDSEVVDSGAEEHNNSSLELGNLGTPIANPSQIKQYPMSAQKLPTPMYPCVQLCHRTNGGVILSECTTYPGARVVNNSIVRVDANSSPFGSGSKRAPTHSQSKRMMTFS